ncbi:MAG: mechanosensitive ion channel family protein [Wujia sp.]
MLLTDIETIQENIQDIDKSKLQQYMDQLLNWLVDKLFDLFIAFVFLFVGFKICRIIVRFIRKSFDRAGLESSVAGFLVSLIKGILYSIVFIMAAAMVGFQVTSLVTILGTASLAVGLALQGSLSNFAGGVLILLMKPFRVGDYIIENSEKCEGTVVSIDIFYTKLRTYDNKVVVIPNGSITAHSIINVTAENYRKVEIMVGVEYAADINKVKGILEKAVNECVYYDKSKEFNVFVDSFESSSIKMGVRFMVNTEDYWNAKWETTEKIKKLFDENGIVIPFNQLEVAIKN